jgi:hypothetical protein
LNRQTDRIEGVYMMIIIAVIVVDNKEQRMERKSRSIMASWNVEYTAFKCMAAIGHYQ